MFIVGWNVDRSWSLFLFVLEAKNIKLTVKLARIVEWGECLVVNEKLKCLF